MALPSDCVYPGTQSDDERAWGPDGALLCNYRATKFKLNLHVFAVIKRLNMPFHIRPSSFGSLFMRVFDGCDVTYR